MHGPKILSGWVWCFLLTTYLGLQAATSVNDLRCEQMVNPQGIDARQPRLSWVLQAGRRDVKQVAYRVLVASSETKLAADNGDVWDSGRVRSDDSVLVPYAGAPLVSREACFWKVRVWTEDDALSRWSPPAKWSMGILQPDEWHARWIGLDGRELTNIMAGALWIWFPAGQPQVAAPVETNYFRRVFTLPAGRTIQRAVLEFTGDNECRASLDQSRLGDADDFKLVDQTNVTDRLAAGGTHVLCLECRNGGTEPNPAGALARLTVEFASGEPLVITTGDQWKVAKAPVSGWDAVAFDDSQWPAARVLGPVGMNPWGKPTIPGARRQPARYLRKDFAVPKEIARATISLCGLGLSDLYLNGQKVGDAVLSPAFSQYDKREFYVTYDVTKNLQVGANTLGVILGNGRYYADRGPEAAGTVSYGWPKLLLNLHLDYADGSSDEVVSDESWQITTNGPIRANNDYDGEEYDARLEMNGWNRPGFDLSRWRGWQPVQIASAPGGVLSAQPMPPIRITGHVRPVAMKERQPGVYIYDLGQNMVGWCRLQVRGPAGTAVKLRHAETLQADGSLYTANLRSAQVTDLYTLRGSERPETWEPRFVTHGFRYVELTGFPGRPNLGTIEGCVVNDDVPPAGYFRCSNELVNRIYMNIVWGTRGNYRSLPTDCPQRDERQGWLGDRSEECKGESYLFDIAPLYAKWRQDMADAQRADGAIPNVAPAYWPIYSDNVTWPSSAIIVPEALERQYGDRATLAKNYAGAKAWMEHMLTLASSNIITCDNYGDWCVPPEEPSLIHSRDPARQTDGALLSTAYFYHDLRLMEQGARTLGRWDEAAHWSQLADEFKIAFNRRFLHRDQGQYGNGTQTSCVLPLAFGLVPDDLRARIFAHLVDKIENETHGHVGTGLIGGQYLNRVLSDNGRPDLSYTLVSQKDYPGWGYMVQQGATTIWELWNGDTADPAMNSGNHVMLVGDLVVWFYEYLAGIAPDANQPGFRHIIMKPEPVGDLRFVQAAHQSPYGLIKSEWRRRPGRFEWWVEIPANTRATAYVPASDARAVYVRDVAPVRFENGRAVFELGSGKYHFTSMD